MFSRPLLSCEITLHFWKCILLNYFSTKRERAHPCASPCASTTLLKFHENKRTVFKPEQSMLTHCLLSTLGPGQTLPQTEELDGDEVMHIRMRSWTPEPHELLHLPQSPQLLHPESATQKAYYK